MWVRGEGGALSDVSELKLTGSAECLSEGRGVVEGWLHDSQLSLTCWIFLPDGNLSLTFVCCVWEEFFSFFFFGIWKRDLKLQSGRDVDLGTVIIK